MHLSRLNKHNRCLVAMPWNSNPSKIWFDSQGQCLLNISGDAVKVCYEEDQLLDINPIRGITRKRTMSFSEANTCSPTHLSRQRSISVSEASTGTLTCDGVYYGTEIWQPVYLNYDCSQFTRRLQSVRMEKGNHGKNRDRLAKVPHNWASYRRHLTCPDWLIKCTIVLL